jgi:hypothetical protein
VPAQSLFTLQTLMMQAQLCNIQRALLLVYLQGFHAGSGFAGPTCATAVLPPPFGLVTVIVPILLYALLSGTAICMYTGPGVLHLMRASTRDAVVKNSVPLGSLRGVL